MEKKKRAHEINRSHTQFIGKAGEYLVAGELLKRGIPVHIPVVDDGVDLIAGGRVRIQVKTRSRMTSQDLKRVGYVFTVGAKRETGAMLVKKLRAKTMDQLFGSVDIVIFVGVGEDSENRFWIVPVSVLRKCPSQQSIMLGSHQHVKKVDIGKMKKMLATGMSQREVGEFFGATQAAISRHTTGLNKPQGYYKDRISVIADDYENAWHEIEQAVNLVNQIDDIDSLLSPSEIEYAEQHFKEFADTSEKR